MPPRSRSWYRNLESNQRFSSHLKGDVQADLEATARLITDPDERQDVFQGLINGLTDPLITAILSDLPPLADWVQFSPLVEVSFDALAS